MKWWFKLVLIFFVLIQIVLSVCLLYEIIKRKYPQVLGAISISSIDKTVNTADTKSNLRYYYEPGVSSKETDTTPWLNGKIVWTYNDDTLNDRFDYTIEKPADTYRVIALGDSFVFGDHVNTADSWPEQLEDLLNAKKPFVLSMTHMKCLIWDYAVLIFRMKSNGIGYGDKNTIRIWLYGCLFPMILRK